MVMCEVEVAAKETDGGDYYIKYTISLLVCIRKQMAPDWCIISYLRATGLNQHSLTYCIYIFNP
jgi:hypothetical protein